MAHQVKCSICGESFDRDKLPFVKTSSVRYAHAKCALDHGNKVQQAEAEKALADVSQDEKDLEKLESYIVSTLQVDYITPRIRKQINDFHIEKGYTYSGILRALNYFYQIRNNSIDKANGGIGIVPYIYDEAERYYKAIWVAKQKNEVKVIEQYVAPPATIITIAPPEPQLRIRRKLFSFLDEGE